MKIPKNISLESVETCYGSSKEIEVLELPKTYDNKDFFEITSFIQLISTCIRNNKNITLKLPIQKEYNPETNNLQIPDDELEFFREAPNYIATIMSWGNSIENLENERIEKRDINKFTSIIRNEMNSLSDSSRSRQKGNILFLTCFDHFANSNGLLNSFYLENSKFYDQNEFFFSPFNDRLSFFSTSFNKGIAIGNLQNTFTEITKIIYELMLNTHEWARTNENYKELSPNVRGIYIKLHKGKIDNLRKKYQNSKGLSSYLSSEFSKDKQGLSVFFEISVFDSGPGFVKRNSTGVKDLSVNEEVKIIKKCLTLHQTSASGHKSIVKGAGLDRISRILDGNGFLKIRTSKSSVFRDFISTPYEDVNTYEEICLKDWESASEKDFTSFEKIEGTTINILYPFRH